jgi:uncharacterized protein (DUF433 family)
MTNASNNLIAAFSEDQVHRLTGLSKRQLGHWDRTSFFSPSFAQAGMGSAFGRIYSFRDVVALRVLSVLRNQYSVSMQHLRGTKEELRKYVSEDAIWTGVKLYVFQRRVFWVERDGELPSEVVSGQFVVPSIELDQVVSQTQNDAQNINQRRSETVGRIEKVRQISHRSPVIAGTRVSVQAIQRFRAAGYSADEILKEYPDLTQEDIDAALKYKQAA